MLMYDFDGVSLATVKTFIEHIQKEYGLDEFYIIQSTHGYNAICINKIAFGLIYSIGNSVFSPADRDFLRLANRRGYYTIRFDSDKKLVETMKNNSNKYDKSLAHALFLEWFFDIKIKREKTFDENTDLIIVQYSSQKNGYHTQFIEDYVTELNLLRARGVKA